MSWEDCKAFALPFTHENWTSRRIAVGLAGVAPRLVPSRGHPALIPDASGLLCVPGLRAVLAPSAMKCGGGAALLFPSTYHTVLAVKGCFHAPTQSVASLKTARRPNQDLHLLVRY